MKLTVRNVPSGGSAPDQSRPFLCFSTLASNMSIVQDLPITKPLPPSRECTRVDPGVSVTFLRVEQAAVVSGAHACSLWDHLQQACVLCAEVDRLVRDLESEVCPFYLDLQPEMQGLQVGCISNTCQHIDDSE